MFSQTKSIRDSMHADFNVLFQVRKRFRSKEEMTETITAFGKKYNIVFSVASSHPKKGQYYYICKHGGIKRNIPQKQIEEIDTIDGMTGEKDGEPTERKKYRKSTQKFNCPAFIRIFNFAVMETHVEHNHPIPNDVTTYALFRKQSPEVMERIYTILAGGHRDPASSVMETLKALNVNNIIKKDIQNIQTLFLKDEGGKEMYSLITCLEDLGYVVRIRVKENQEITGLFFIQEEAINKARLWPEALSIDATYKTNAHKMSLVNIVGTSNTSSVKSSSKLQTFAVAAAFINSETEVAYTWILNELREAVWPAGSTFRTPSVIITDNEQALRNGVENIFPESQHLLCSWHLWNTMETKLPIGTISGDEYNLRRTDAEVEFKKAMSSYNEMSYQEAIMNFEQIVSTPGYFKNNGATALSYLRDVLMQEDEIKR